VRAAYKYEGLEEEAVEEVEVVREVLDAALEVVDDLEDRERQEEAEAAVRERVAEEDVDGREENQVVLAVVGEDALLELHARLG
jgi:hypothetical protein